MNLRRFPSLAVAAILAAGLLLYGRTLPFPFVFDDHIYLVGNPLMKDLHSFAFPADFAAFIDIQDGVAHQGDRNTRIQA